MKSVNDVLKGKGGQLSIIAPNATVYEAIKLMADMEIGALLVMEGDNLLGILTERDYEIGRASCRERV